MSAFPRIFRVVRDGHVQDVRIENLDDLCSILRDAAHPEAVTRIARIDREAPDLQRRIHHAVVREANAAITCARHARRVGASAE